MMKTFFIICALLLVQELRAESSSEDSEELWEEVEDLSKAILLPSLKAFENEIERISNHSSIFQESVEKRTEAIIDRYGNSSLRCLVQYQNQLDALVNKSTSALERCVDRAKAKDQQIRKKLEDLETRSEELDQKLDGIINQCKNETSNSFEYLNCLNKNLKSVKVDSIKIRKEYRWIVKEISHARRDLQKCALRVERNFYQIENKIFRNIEKCIRKIN